MPRTVDHLSAKWNARFTKNCWSFLNIATFGWNYPWYKIRNGHRKECWLKLPDWTNKAHQINTREEKLAKMSAIFVQNLDYLLSKNHYCTSTFLLDIGICGQSVGGIFKTTLWKGVCQKPITFIIHTKKEKLLKTRKLNNAETLNMPSKFLCRIVIFSTQKILELTLLDQYSQCEHNSNHTVFPLIP